MKEREQRHMVSVYMLCFHPKLKEGKLSISHLGTTNIVIDKLHYISALIAMLTVMYFIVFQFPYLVSPGNLVYNNTSNGKTIVSITCNRLRTN